MAPSTRFVWCGLVLCCLTLSSNWAQTQTEKPFPIVPATVAESAEVVAESEGEVFVIPENEQPFWDSAQAFLDAYMARDSVAIGELFTEDAEFFDEFGERTIGREDIVLMFQDVFDAGLGSTIDEITIERVRHISDTVALEEGFVVATAEAGSAPHRSRYVALHSKTADGKWLINTLKDYPREEGERVEQLAEMSWLLGTWVNQQDGEVVKTECDWSEDGNYLMRRFEVSNLGDEGLKGVQRIGWDPVRKQIRSWTFDSRGGFFDGFWMREGNQWISTITGVSADGEQVSAVAVYTVIDAEMIEWQYRNMVVGSELRENLPPVVMVRPAPEPTISSED